MTSSETLYAVEWLTGFHPEPPWIIIEIDPTVERVHPRAHSFNDRTALTNYIETQNGRVNLYFIPNRTVPDIKTTPNKNQITHITSLYVDLDLPKVGPYTEPNEANFARLKERIDALEPRPTSLVYSGGGYQAFWMFPEPLGMEHADAVEKAGSDIAKQLRSDAVQNINRLMRLPGTWNIPNAKKQALGRIKAIATCVDNDSSRTYDLLKDPIPKLSLEATYGPEEIEVEESTAGHTADLPQKWQKLVKTGDASDYNGDRSALVMAFIAVCIRKRWTDDQIFPYLVDARYGISEHCRRQGNTNAVAKRQLERVRDKIKSDWEYTGRGGIDNSSIHNLKLAFSKLDCSFSYNAFDGRIYLNEKQEWSDHLEAEAKVAIREQFGWTPSRDTLQDVVIHLARENTYHPIHDWLDTLEWDGTPRIDTWLIRHVGAKDNDFIRAISRIILIAACRRVRKPGSEFHEMLVLISPKQGTGKSSTIRSLARNPEWFTDSLPLKISEQKTIEQLQGKWLVECSELAGIHGSDVESLNVLLSRNTDRARMAYGRNPVSVSRQCVFFGTTNLEAFLRGRENRRFWPVRVTKDKIDIFALIKERDQLWAEANFYEKNEESIRLDPSLWLLAAEAQDEARFGDPWVDIIRNVLSDDDGKLLPGRIVFDTIWQVIGKPGHFRTHSDNGRIVDVMYELGFERKVLNLGKSMRGFQLGKETREIGLIGDGSIPPRWTACYKDSELFKEYERFGQSRNEGPF